MNKEICDFSALRLLRKEYHLSIASLAEKSGVSASVISKLERNQNTAEMETLYRIAKVFGLTLSDLISFAENRTSQRAEPEHYLSGDFHFDRVSYRNIRCMHSVVRKGDRVCRPEIHRDDYEICWVIRGRICITLPKEKMELDEGNSVQFDALLPHTYEALEDSEIFIVHKGKGKRF